ncbi:hypothetical protein QA646_08605 [Rhizobium sp. CB3090]|uniref:hypothetical protein n=1 Tax=Rhizobium sp. CB3090 TaxID=3039156 RepID=UPI0024B18B6D|nr:hypothetical protein [Rhizobium sp. CB3090]WFU10883.1 hypothetical protein QA646_08605 [Rhizobium sp. CB3090]
MRRRVFDALRPAAAADGVVMVDATICKAYRSSSGARRAPGIGMAVNITGHETNGVALCNHVRSFDIVSRVQQKTARFVDTLDADTVDEIVGRVVGIIDPA